MPLSIDLSISCCRVAPAVFFFLLFAVLSLMSLGALSVEAAGPLAAGMLVAGGLAGAGLAAGALACSAAGAGAFAGVWAAGAEGGAGAAAGVEGGAGLVAGAAVPESGALCASADAMGAQRRIAVAAREAMVRIENSRFLMLDSETVSHSPHKSIIQPLD